MRLLLDTHALLWWLADNATLNPTARGAIADPANDVYVSAATAWEIAIKQRLGKLDAPPDLEAQILGNDLEPLPISIGHAVSAGSLPRQHDDPFDRMLIAQARMEQLAIVTRDARFHRYDIPLLTA